MVSLVTLNFADRIVIDRQTSQAIRYALKTLLEETERQRKIVRGLIEDNQQLRAELRLERNHASRQEQRANDLDIIVENIKHKIRQLEDESIANASQQHNQVKELQKDKQASQVRYHQQADKLQEQEETIVRLEKELCRMGLEEEERIATQKKMFRQFCKRAPRTQLDQQYVILPTAQELKLYKHQVRKLEKTLKNIKIDSIIRSPGRAPLVMHMQRKEPPRNSAKDNDQECGFEHLPLTIELWADQLLALKNLHRSLKKLFLQLMPWHTVAVQDDKECIRVEDLQLMVDEMSEEVESEEKKSHVPSQQTLYAIVSHFQKLFDVNSLNGVYPRMNEVYTKLGEMTNAMRNLRDLLELDTAAPPGVLVNTVGKLCSLFRENVTWQVEQLLGTQDIQSIIYKLEEHDDFFPAFQALTENLLHILGVRNLTDIVPAVQQLIWKAQ
uniref:Centrosomal protein of 70 kDa n=1 Tax=Varanus komodoensis TaxID=61221 RepID=A0A8D2IYL4_VARKO